jgi:acyl-CoA thioester hydrolase
MIPVPLWLHTATVLPGWIDYNGHMTDGYYAVVFGAATDAVLDYLGLDAAYRARTACSVYTVELHLNYERELKSGAALKTASMLLGVDARRLQVFHSLYHADEGYLAATNEVMLLHVNPQPRATPLPPDRLAWARQVATAHAASPRPPQAGRRVVQLGQPDSNP